MTPMKKLLPLLEHTASDRYAKAHHASSLFVSSNMNGVVGAEYFAELARLDAIADREWARKERWFIASCENDGINPGPRRQRTP